MTRFYLHYGESEEKLFFDFLSRVGEWQEKWTQGQAYMLVPEHTKLFVEQAYLEKFSHTSLMLADVKSFLRLARDLLLLAGVKMDALAKKNIKYFSMLQLLEKEKEKLPTLSPFLLADQYLSAISDLKRNQINASALSNKVQEAFSEGKISPDMHEKLSDFSFFYEHFEKELKENGLEDQDDLLPKATQLLKDYQKGLLSPFQAKELSFLKKLHLYIYGFGDFRALSQQEVDFLTALLPLLSGMHVYLALPENLSFEELKNRSYDELLLLDPYAFSRLCAKQFLEMVKIQEVSFQFSCYPKENLEQNHFSAQVISFSKEQEAKHFVVGLLWNLLKEKKAEDIALVTDQDESSLRFLLTDMAQLSIPYYFEGSKTLSDSFLFKEFDVLKKWLFFPQKSKHFFLLLRSCFFSFSPDYLFSLENFLLSRAFVSGKALEKDLVIFKEKMLEKNLFSADLLEQNEKQIFSFFKESQKLKEKQKQSFSSFLNQFVNFLNQQAFHLCYEKTLQQNKKYGLEDLYLQKQRDWKAFQSFLLSLQKYTKCNQHFQTKEYSLKQCFDLFYQCALRTQTEGIPNKKGQIYIGSLEKALAQGKRCYVVLESSLSSFPYVAGKEGFLKEKERNSLSKLFGSLLPSKKKYSPYLSRVFMDRLLKKAQEGLYLLTAKEEGVHPRFFDVFSSYGFSIEKKHSTDFLSLEDARLYSQSYRLRFQSILPKYEKRGKKEEKLSPDLLKLIQGENHAYSVSQIEKYRQSPFLYFVDYVLGLKERKTFEVRPAEAGTLLHAVLENFFENYKKMSLQEKEHFEASLQKEEILEQKLQTLLENEIEKDEILFPYLMLNLRRNALRSYRKELLRLVPVFFLELYRKNGKFLPQSFEWKFLEKITPEITLKGIVDRVDYFVTKEENTLAYRIVDYKSGAKDIDYVRLYMGLDLQLPLYAHIFSKYLEKKEAKLPLKDMGYLKLRWDREKEEHFMRAKEENNFEDFYESFASEKQISQRKEQDFSTADLLTALQEHSLLRLEEAVKSLQNGSFPLVLFQEKEQEKPYLQDRLQAYVYRYPKNIFQEQNLELYKELTKKGEKEKQFLLKTKEEKEQKNASTT